MFHINIMYLNTYNISHIFIKCDQKEEKYIISMVSFAMIANLLHYIG